MKEVLRIEGLTKSYRQHGKGKEVLRDLDLTVRETEFVCVLGPSGCGKSTLLRCVAGFEEYEGKVFCNGREVSTPSTDRIMVFQDYNQLFPWKTVEANICYPLKIGGLRDKAAQKEICREVLQKVGLDGFQHYYPHELAYVR